VSEALLSGRAAAQQAVLAVLKRTTFVNETLAALRHSGQLPAREAGLATEIALGTIRHLHTLDYVLGKVATYAPRSVTPEARAILLTGAYQAIWLDRVPLWAVVNEAVDLAGRELPRKAVGMVNAILRRVTGAITERRVDWQSGEPQQVRVSWDRACQFDQAVMPQDGAAGEAYGSIASGESRDRFVELVKRFGQADGVALAWASQATPSMVLQRHPLRISAEKFQQLVREEFDPHATVTDTAAYLSTDVPLIDHAAFRAGQFYIQDETAQEAARVVAATAGERILDLCAAPGGKAVAMALAMEDRGEVVAGDVDPRRLVQVSANADRLGLESIRTHLIDEAADELSLSGEFDAALVDAPCSNTGVIARRPEARLGLTRKKMNSLVTLQGELLRRAAEKVRPGGRLVYSTCGLEPEENDGVVQAFVKANPDWQSISARLTLPRWGASPADWRDGGFVALLNRASD
jgi:16S rRNA (cytosine967-C5)-methyltransferase